MEEKLKQLFDFQRFERNPRLDRLMAETRERYGVELADEDLELVNAAGELLPQKQENTILPQKAKN